MNPFAGGMLSSLEGDSMARRRLQQIGDLRASNGWWRLRWREDVIRDGQTVRQWSQTVVVGPGPGNKTRVQ